MKKLRHPLWVLISTVAVAMSLLSLAAAGALAESTAESPGVTEPAPPVEGSSPPAPGWVPQGEAAEDTGGATTPTQRGSSLGSGAGSAKPESSDEEAVPSEPPAPAPVSSGSYEPEEESSPYPYEEPASAPESVPASEPAPSPEPADVSLGVADPVARASSPQDSARSAPQVEGRQVANTSGQAAAGSDGLLWPTLIVGMVILLYAGARLLLGPVELDIFRSSPFRRVRRGYPRV